MLSVSLFHYYDIVQSYFPIPKSKYEYNPKHEHADKPKHQHTRESKHKPKTKPKFNLINKNHIKNIRSIT